LGRRADEGEPVSADDFGEALVLGQEAVPRMDGVAAGDERGADHGRGEEVAPLRVGRPDADGLVGQLDGQALPVGLAVRHDSRDAEQPAGAQDAQRDLAAIGDEDLLEHQPSPVRAGAPASPTAAGAGALASSSRTSSWPYSTASPDSTTV